jgi:hypothetical protein
MSVALLVDMVIFANTGEWELSGRVGHAYMHSEDESE